MEGNGFGPSHVVGAQGAPYWVVPDPARPADGRLDPHLPVQVLEQATGWFHVRCSNGWETWVDGRYLTVPGATPTPQAAGPAAWSGARRDVDAVGIGLTVAGALLAVLGGFLPWITAPSDSLSAWDIPVKSLFDTQNIEEGLDTGVVLLLLLVALVPLATRQPFPRAVTGGLAAFALVIVGLGFRLYADIHDLAPEVGLGIGLILTAVGGLVLLVAALRPS